MPNPSRRSFLRALASLPAAAASWNCGGQRAAGPLRNVLFLCSDDHAAYVLGAYGNTVVRTPNLDRLAAQGARFDAAFANCPFCTPSRQSVITGRYPHASGVTLLQTPLAEEQVTIADHLKQSGFKTAAVGKMHFNSKLKHGFDYRIDSEDHDAYLAENPARKPPPDQPYKPVWQPFRVPAREWLNADRLPGTGYPHPADPENQGLYDEDFLGTYFVRQAADFMAQHRDERMCVWLSFYEPHSPYNFPIEDAKNHDPARVPLPQPGPEDGRWVPAIFRDIAEVDRRGIVAAYYNSVEYLDRNIGRALDALDELGLAESTLVVYVGDHGYLLNHHGRFEKHMMWDEAVRVPLLIRDPRAPGRSVAALVEMVDLVPTILDALGAPPMPSAQGRSLLPLIHGKADDHRDFVFSEYFHDNKAMVRTERWKYIYTTGEKDLQLGYETGFGPSGPLRRLYDLHNDPNETRNVAEDPANASVVDELEQRMLSVFLETDPRAPRIPADLPRTDALAWFLEPPETSADR
jgi:choline-sulfatase